MGRSAVCTHVWPSVCGKVCIYKRGREAGLVGMWTAPLLKEISGRHSPERHQTGTWILQAQQLPEHRFQNIPCL